MTIFENLVYNENTFTELFKNLMRYKIFRKLFLEQINKDLLEYEIPFEDFSTQKTTENGRPDLVISNLDMEIFIEIKVYDTALTINQPTGYLKELEKSKKIRQLVLLIPHDYKYLQEYNSRKEELQSPIPCTTIYWENIIQKIEEEEIHDSNPILSEYLTLLKQWFEAPKIFLDQQFMKFMNDKFTPQNLEKLSKIIHQLKDTLHKKDIKIGGFNKKILDEYGFYYDTDSFKLFIGEWFEYWKHSGSPLCFALKSNNDQTLDRFKKVVVEQGYSEVKAHRYYDVQWHCSDIKINTNLGEVDINELANKIVAIIKATEVL